MTLNLKMMEYGMQKVGFNKNEMANYTDVSYSVIHNLLSGKTSLEKVSLKVYAKFESLFTRTELMKAGDSFVNPEEYKGFWMDMFKEALSATDAKVERSGAPTVVPRGNGGYYQTLPVYTAIKWRFRDGQATMSLRIWDQQLYRDLNNKGQLDKKELVRIWAESAKREGNI